MIMRKRISVIIATAIILCGIIIAMYFSNVNNTEAVPAHNGPSAIVVANDMLTATNLSDMVDNSDLVVLGTYEEFDSTWNLARNPNDISKASDEEYIEGKVYNFNIEEVLMGDIEESKIKISHTYSNNITVEFTSGDEEVSPEGILVKEPTTVEYFEVENLDPTFISPTFNEKHIVFLQDDIVDNIYMGALEPYLIKFDNNNNAVLLSNLTNDNHEDLKNIVEVNGKNIAITNEVDLDFDDTITGKDLNEIKDEIEKEVKR